MSPSRNRLDREKTYPAAIRAEILADRSSHNHDVLVPLSGIASIVCAIFLLQHSLSPGPVSAWRDQAYWILYSMGCAAGVVTMVVSLTVVKTFRPTGRYRFSLLCSTLMVVYGATLSLVDSEMQTESIAFALVVLVLASTLRAGTAFYVAVILTGSAAFTIAHLVIWGPTSVAAGMEIVMITFFSLWISITMENRRRELFLLKRELSLQNEKLSRNQSIDPLTGLWNRSAFVDHARIHAQQFRRYGYPLSILLIDVDRFRNINDEHGKLTGDGVIKGVADVISTCIRSSDDAGRYGGEEIAVLLTNTPEKAALEVADRIRASISKRVFTDHAVNVTASVGVACFESGDDDTDDVLMRADKALYSAKQGGRNVVYSGTGMYTGESGSTL